MCTYTIHDVCHIDTYIHIYTPYIISLSIKFHSPSHQLERSRTGRRGLVKRMKTRQTEVLGNGGILMRFDGFLVGFNGNLMGFESDFNGNLMRF